MQEIWKDITDYEGYYQVSNLGRVRSVERVVRHSCGELIRPVHSKILKQSAGDYPSVLLSKDGKHRTYRVHRLVAMAFIPNPENYPIVNHIDLNTRNNTISNLEWVTQQYNCNHAIANGHSPKISEQGRAKITAGAIAYNGYPVLCITTGQQFNSVADAQRGTGINVKSIHKSAKLQKPLRMGLEFRYIRDIKPSNASTCIRIAPECLIK